MAGRLLRIATVLSCSALAFVGILNLLEYALHYHPHPYRANYRQLLSTGAIVLQFKTSADRHYERKDDNEMKCVHAHGSAADFGPGDVFAYNAANHNREIAPAASLTTWPVDELPRLRLSAALSYGAALTAFSHEHSLFLWLWNLQERCESRSVTVLPAANFLARRSQAELPFWREGH